MFTFIPEKLQTSNKIGSGRFGSVYPYQKEETDQRWVVKHIKAENHTQLKFELGGIVQGSNHDHPSILPIRGYYLQEHESGSWDAYIKLPRMQSNFKEYKEEYTKKKAVIPKELMARYFYSLASALDYLEKKRIAHQNLKPTNILLDQNMKVYLADTGMPRYASEEEKSKGATDLAGSELYMAPELFTTAKPLKKEGLIKADIWSLGLVIAELGLSKPRTIEPSLAPDAKAKIVKEIVADFRKNYGQTMPDLINASLNLDPSQRPSFADIAKGLVAKYPDVAVVTKEKSLIGEEIKQGTTAYGLFSTGAYLYKKAEDLLGNDKKKGVIERFEEKKEVKVAKAVGSFLGAKAGGLFGSSKKKEETDKPDEKKGEQIAVEQSPKEFRVDATQGVLIRPANPSKVNDQKVEELLKNTLTATIQENSNSLRINLRGCNELTDQTLKGIGSTITESAKDLKQLTVDLRGCKKITDAGVKELTSQVLQKLHNLEQISLDFSGCAQLTNESLVQISSNFGKNGKALQQLSLEFSRCSKITDDGLKKLSAKIAENLKEIQHLELSFYECEKVNDQTLNSVREELSFIPYLVI